MSIKMRLEKLEATKAKTKIEPLPLSYFYGGDATPINNERVLILNKFYESHANSQEAV